MPVRSIKFICASCSYSETLKEDFPQKWTLIRYSDHGMHWSCPKCKSFMYPVDFEKDIKAENSVDPFRLFARCPNAEACNRAENYHPMCERLSFTPRCLAPLYQYIEDIDLRLERLEDSWHDFVSSREKRR